MKAKQIQGTNWPKRKKSINLLLKYFLQNINIKGPHCKTG